MKILTSYFTGIRDQSHGESYVTIIRYFVPEFITALVLRFIYNRCLVGRRS